MFRFWCLDVTRRVSEGLTRVEVVPRSRIGLRFLRNIAITLVAAVSFKTRSSRDAKSTVKSWLNSPGNPLTFQMEGKTMDTLLGILFFGIVTSLPVGILFYFLLRDSK